MGKQLMFKMMMVMMMVMMMMMMVKGIWKKWNIPLPVRSI
jgi:hypothetical protein